VERPIVPNHFRPTMHVSTTKDRETRLVLQTCLCVTTRVTTVTTLCMLVSSAFIVNKLVFFFALLC
jgi:hypothetical protein